MIDILSKIVVFNAIQPHWPFWRWVCSWSSWRDSRSAGCSSSPWCWRRREWCRRSAHKQHIASTGSETSKTSQSSGAVWEWNKSELWSCVRVKQVGAQELCESETSQSSGAVWEWNKSELRSCVTVKQVRAQELCDSETSRSWGAVCEWNKSELRSCVKVEVDVQGSSGSLVVRTVSVDVKQHWTSLFTELRSYVRVEVDVLL